MSKIKTLAEKIEETKQQLEQLEAAARYVPIDTEDLQCNELDEFVWQLGYFNEENGAYLSYGKYPHLERISFTTAVKLYNVDNWEQDGNTFHPKEMPQFNFPAHVVRRAWFGKLFKKLKLQWDKKEMNWINGSDKLSPMYPEYYEMFIVPLIKERDRKVINRIFALPT